MISAHSAPVYGVIFNPLDSTVAYSCSLDHTVRTFDLTTTTLVDTRTTSHPLYSITALPGVSSQLLAAGTSARHITLLDPRVSASSMQVMTLRGHTNLVSCLSPDPHSNYGLVSGSNDGTCRVWDLRSSRQGTKEEGSGSVGEAMYIIERKSQEGAKKPVRLTIRAIPTRDFRIFYLILKKICSMRRNKILIRSRRLAAKESKSSASLGTRKSALSAVERTKWCRSTKARALLELSSWNDTPFPDQE
jgi:WD40 repeat protein